MWNQNFTVGAGNPPIWLLLGSGLVGLILWRKRTAYASAFSSPTPQP